MTEEDVLRYQYHESWPDGCPCLCDTCRQVRVARRVMAGETRDEALRRGHSRSVADRAASYRMRPLSQEEAISAATR